MSFNYSKSSRFLILSACLSIINIIFSSSIVEAKNQPQISPQIASQLSIIPDRSLDLHLLLSRRLGAQTKSASFELEQKFELLESSQTIPLHDQTLIAKSFRGEASWYGPGFHGRLTANGERYNQNAMTAAHPYLRFGTMVKVTNLNNGRSAIVRINDRGPYAKGRIIDVSAAAARSLDMIHSGVAPVRVDILGR